MAPMAGGVGLAVGTLVSPLDGLLFAGGYLLGNSVEPDMDQISITGSEGRMLKRFGIFGIMWVAYWLPYAYIMPHRSTLSHFPLLSTAIRHLYLVAPIVFALWWFRIVVPIDTVLFHYLWVLLGNSLSDAVHYLLDVVN